MKTCIYLKRYLSLMIICLLLSGITVQASEEPCSIGAPASTESNFQPSSLDTDSVITDFIPSEIVPFSENEIRMARTSSIFDSENYWQVLKLTNKERAAQGLWPLSTNDDFIYAANIRAVEIGSLFEHSRPDGSECFSVLDECGIPYYTAGENIAYGPNSAPSVVNGWMNSAGHRQNILSLNFVHLGNGWASNGSTNYWTQLFLNQDCDPQIEEITSDVQHADCQCTGTSVDNMALVLVTSCSHGTSYIPIMNEMIVNNFNPSKSGEQVLEIGYNGQGISIPIYIYPFHDVQNTWYTKNVIECHKNGWMTGLSTTNFGVNDTLYRAQFATVLHRLEGKPIVTGSSIFPDIPDNLWYTNPVIWASNNSIVTGYSNSGLFGPNDKITRAQMAVMFKRYADFKNYDTSARASLDSFKDKNSIQAYSADALSWAVGQGIITGKDNGTQLDPQGNTSRAECASMLVRFMKTYNLY